MSLLWRFAHLWISFVFPLSSPGSLGGQQWFRSAWWAYYCCWCYCWQEALLWRLAGGRAGSRGRRTCSVRIDLSSTNRLTAGSSAWRFLGFHERAGRETCLWQLRLHSRSQDLAWMSVPSLTGGYRLACSQRFGQRYRINYRGPPSFLW